MNRQNLKNELHVINLEGLDNPVVNDLKESETLKKLRELRLRFLKIKGQTRPVLERICDPKIKISVVVPVFNTEKYIAKCLDSILAQTFEDFEVICVNDASTDTSAEIIDRYARMDARIKVIHHSQNLGLGGARNTAILAAKGEYLASVDSDDYIRPTMLEKLITEAKRTNADIVVCGFQRVDESGNLLEPQKQKEKVINSDDNPLDIFSTTNPAFWNKLWRTDLFIENNIFFPNYVFYQDLATTPRILTKVKRIAFIPDLLYMYLIREGSATYSNSPKHIVDYFTVFTVLREYLWEQNLYEQHKRGFFVALNRALKFRSSNIMNSALPEKSKAEYIQYLKLVQHAFLGSDPGLSKLPAHNLIKDFEPDSLSLYGSVPAVKMPISIMVKTICRPDMVRRFLTSAGEYQIRHNKIFAEILVGDDSPPDFKQKNKEVIDEVQKLYPALHVRHLELDYDVGVSYGRNALVENAISDWVLQCDDDFILDCESDIEKARQELVAHNVDILGGWLKNKYDETTGEYSYRAALGYFLEKDEELVLNVNEDKYETPSFATCDFIMNFFIARREVLRLIKWDPDLKVEEHHEFFYRCFKAGVRTALTKTLFAKHTYEKKRNPKEYTAHRFEKGRWEGFLYLSVQKMGKKRRTIRTTKVDHIHVWETDLSARKNKEITLPRTQ